ncbi:mucin-2-like [Physella acuta]|uniref:mucin-2-like n=1 Tax=Physella acuta TaxID=109671 RepID=UPI0027DD27C8|nr:mucin-2-like [Physella acuta]
MPSVTRCSASSLEHVCESGSVSSLEGDSSTNFSMDKISTMTLSEFKSLLSSGLAVQENQQQQSPERGSKRRGSGEAGGNLNCGALKEKTRSVRDSISSRASARRAGSNASSVPQSPDEDKGLPGDPPKTPQSSRRSLQNSTISRPKTPTSLGGYRPKTPTGSKDEYKMARPKTPSQIKRDAVAKVAGAISNWVESRPEMDTPEPITVRPKTPTRPKTPSGICGNISENDSQDGDLSVDSEGHFPKPHLPLSIKERPNTPSRIPKPMFLSRPTTPKVSNSLASNSPTEDFNPSCTFSQSRPIAISAPRPALLSRSNSNSSSVRSEDAPVSPSSSFSEEKTLKSATSHIRPTSIISRKQQTTPGSSNTSYKDLYNARRAYTPGPGPSSQAVTPGPREKWTIGANGEINVSSIGGGGGGNQARRGSLDTCWSNKTRPESQKTQSSSLSSSLNAYAETSMSITNEITFSDDEEINELVRSTAFRANALNKRVRSSSVDARKLNRKANKVPNEEVLMIRRDGAGSHGVQVTNKSEVKYDSTPKANVFRRPTNPNGSSQVRSRSQTPDSALVRQKTGSVRSTGSGGETGDRTEAWVDSTLSDTKRKLPPRAKRNKGVVSDIPASELEPRPLDEIKAILPELKNGYVHVDTESLEAPPEDPETYRKMEKLFEKLREKELRASVNETPGGAEEPQSDGKHKKASSQARSSPSIASMRTSSGSVISSDVSSGHGNITGRACQPEDNRFKRSSSVPGSFQKPQDTAELSSSPTSGLNGTYSPGRQTTIPDTDPHPSDALNDISAEMAKNPTALVSKIKEILKVRPRKDENSETPTRIPGPSSLTKNSRSKSVTNLYSTKLMSSSELYEDDLGVHKNSTSVYCYSSDNKITKTNSTSSSNIAYTEFLYSDTADEVPELSQTWSVKSDSGDSQNRSETPVPKLATPLTTGRSTLIGRRVDRLSRGSSQDKENLSNSQSSLSGRSVFSAVDDDAEFV